MYRKKGFATLVPHNMTEPQVTLGSSGKAGDKHWMIDMNTNTNTNKIVIYGTMPVVFVRLIGQQNQLLFISLKMKFGNQFVCSVFFVCMRVVCTYRCSSVQSIIIVGTLISMSTKALTMGFHQHKAVAIMAEASISQLKVLLRNRLIDVSINWGSENIYTIYLPIVLHELGIITLGIEQ